MKVPLATSLIQIIFAILFPRRTFCKLLCSLTVVINSLYSNINYGHSYGTGIVTVLGDTHVKRVRLKYCIQYRTGILVCTPMLVPYVTFWRRCLLVSPLFLIGSVAESVLQAFQAEFFSLAEQSRL